MPASDSRARLRAAFSRTLPTRAGTRHYRVRWDLIRYFAETPLQSSLVENLCARCQSNLYIFTFSHRHWTTRRRFKPRIECNNVDLPDPDGPEIITNSPEYKLRWMSLSTVDCAKSFTKSFTHVFDFYYHVVQRCCFWVNFSRSPQYQSVPTELFSLMGWWLLVVPFSFIAVNLFQETRTLLLNS